MSIEQQNELIAKFMRVEPYEDSRYGTLYTSPVDGKTAFGLEYHSSWDWLMPVVKKCKDYLDKMERPSQHHCHGGDLIEVDLQCHLWDCNLQKTFDQTFLLVQWITDYEKSLTTNSTTNVP